MGDKKAAKNFTRLAAENLTSLKTLECNAVRTGVV
jgi:hypothetical protein